jgi:hypothetical protein
MELTDDIRDGGVHDCTDDEASVEDASAKSGQEEGGKRVKGRKIRIRDEDPEPEEAVAVQEGEGKTAEDEKNEKQERKDKKKKKKQKREAVEAATENALEAGDDDDLLLVRASNTPPIRPSRKAALEAEQVHVGCL